MNIDTLRTAISEVISKSSCSAEFYFLLESNGTITIKRADIEESAQQELAASFIESISATILLNDELSLPEISSADDRAHAIYRYDPPVPM
jgi:hypothetical protein